MCRLADECASVVIGVYAFVYAFVYARSVRIVGMYTHKLFLFCVYALTVIRQ